MSISTKVFNLKKPAFAALNSLIIRWNVWMKLIKMNE